VKKLTTKDYNRKAVDKYQQKPEVKKRLKVYRRIANLKRYGMTIESYDLLLKKQGYKCAICKTPEPKGNGRFHVDHSHQSNKVRGLLCLHCNTLLGYAKDDETVLIAAALYIKQRN
jgi:hypothetical protein